MYVLSRVQLLLQQQKFDLAEKELALHLSQNPNDALAYSMSALVNLGLKKQNKAIDAAQKGISLAPENHFTHYVLSKCYLHQDKYKKAEQAIKSALHLAPNDADYLCQLAAIYNDTKQYDKALTSVNEALEIDPESDNSKRIKAVIFRGMGKYKEADALANEALHRNPEDANTFAVKGWTALDTGQTKESLECFKTAVMMEPTNEYAKSGLVMALKAQNKLFNLFYQYYNWVNRLPSMVRFGLVVGIVILMRFINNIKESNPTIAPLLSAVVIAYIGFVFLVWTIDPIFNIFLRFNKYGKHALDKGQTLGANVMAGLLLFVALQGVVYLAWDFYPLGAVYTGLFLSLPIASTFARYNTKGYKIHVAITIGLGTAYLLFIATDLSGMYAIAGLLNMAVIFGVIIYSWVGSFIK